MKIPDWEWLKRKMSMDKAEEDFERVMAKPKEVWLINGQQYVRLEPKWFSRN